MYRWVSQQEYWALLQVQDSAWNLGWVWLPCWVCQGSSCTGWASAAKAGMYGQ